MALQLNLHTNIYFEAVEVLTFSPGLLCTFVFDFFVHIYYNYFDCIGLVGNGEAAVSSLVTSNIHVGMYFLYNLVCTLYRLKHMQHQYMQDVYTYNVILCPPICC